MQALLGRARFWLDFQLAHGVKAQHALVGQQEANGTVGAGADTVQRIERLVGLGEHPVGRAVRQKFHHAAKLDDPNGLAGFCGSGSGPRREAAQTCDQHHPPDEHDPRFHMPPRFQLISCIHLFKPAAAAMQALHFAGFTALPCIGYAVGGIFFHCRLQKISKKSERFFKSARNQSWTGGGK